MAINYPSTNNANRFLLNSMLFTKPTIYREAINKRPRPTAQTRFVTEKYAKYMIHSDLGDDRFISYRETGNSIEIFGQLYDLRALVRKTFPSAEFRSTGAHHAWVVNTDSVQGGVAAIISKIQQWKTYDFQLETTPVLGHLVRWGQLWFIPVSRFAMNYPASKYDSEVDSERVAQHSSTWQEWQESHLRQSEQDKTSSIQGIRFDCAMVQFLQLGAMSAEQSAIFYSKRAPNNAWKVRPLARWGWWSHRSVTDLTEEQRATPKDFHLDWQLETEKDSLSEWAWLADKSSNRQRVRGPRLFQTHPDQFPTPDFMSLQYHDWQSREAIFPTLTSSKTHHWPLWLARYALGMPVSRVKNLAAVLQFCVTFWPELAEATEATAPNEAILWRELQQETNSRLNTWATKSPKAATELLKRVKLAQQAEEIDAQETAEYLTTFAAAHLAVEIENAQQMTTEEVLNHKPIKFMFLYDDEGNLLKHKVGSFQLPNHKNRTEKLKRSDDYPLVKMYKFLTTGEAHNPAEFFNPSVNWMREIVQQGDKIDPGKLSVEARVTYDELLRQVAEHQSIQKPVNENYYQKKKSVVEHVYKVQSQILKENPGKKTRSSIFLTLDDVDKIYADFLAQQAVKRPAGRPRKARTPEELAAMAAKVKRPVGRPRKAKTPEELAAMAAKVKLSVGRPRKERTPEELAATAAAKQQKAELIAQRRAVREARAMAPKRPVGRPKTIQTPEQKAAKAAAIAAYQANYRARRRAKKHAAEGAQAKFKGN